MNKIYDVVEEAGGYVYDLSAEHTDVEKLIEEALVEYEQEQEDPFTEYYERL